MLSLVSLLFIATGVYFLSKKTAIPYTILLVLVGLALIPVSKLEAFNFFQSFTLTPGLLFFVFLPTLIFESAYNMSIRNMLQSIRSISLLSVVSLLVSVFFIAFVLQALAYLIGFPLPFAVTLIFGALISATDPVAVLALFKEYGAPKRLSLIFEGESLFNDGTALALFLVILEIYLRQFGAGAEVLAGGLWSDIMGGTFTFATMVFGGILFGGLMGVLFSKIIEQVRDNVYIEITLTMIVAHFTFILSELLSAHLSIAGHDIHFSSIIATVIAAMVVGNYGRYKISPAVVEYMENFWGYFAFVANSIVFILIGLLFASLPISLVDILPITLATILVVAVGRAVSVYPVIGLLNLSKSEEHIPATWQHLLAWGSLRGALAITMVLLIPDNFTVTGWQYDFSVKEFIIALTIACIYFTLFIKGATIGPMMRHFKLTQPSVVEMGEYHEAKALVYAKVVLEIERFLRKGYISESIHRILKEKYTELYRRACAECKHTFDATDGVPERVLTIFALATAKHSLKSLFFYNEVNETVYKKILNDLTTQLELSEESRFALPITLADFKRDWLDGLHDLWEEFIHRDPEREKKTLYMYHRAQSIIMKKAVEELGTIAESDLEIFENKEIFAALVRQLEVLGEDAQVKAHKIKGKAQDAIGTLALAFAEAGIYKAEKKFVVAFGEREVISPKVRALLMEELESAQR